jgi:HSP20 family protein
MARTRVIPRPTNAVSPELDDLQQRIRKRAYELFRERGEADGALGNWLRAERELVWRPAIALREKDGRFEILAAVPGVDAGDLDVQVSPEAILIVGNVAHQHTPNKGTIHQCEFEGGRLFRAIHLPAKIDPGKVKTEYRNGMLLLTAPIAAAAYTRTAKIEAARRRPSAG